MAREQEHFEITNKGEKEYIEEFGGKLIRIPAGGSVVMKRRDAVQFMAGYVPYDREKEAGLKPLVSKPTTKPLTVFLNRPEVSDPNPELVNPVTGQPHASKDELDKDLKEFAHLKLPEKKN